MSDARYGEKYDDGVQCTLCPHNCRLCDGQRGICRVRYNRNNIMQCEIDANFSSVALDPIEKKPLYHFLPTSRTLSFGTIGCNLRCSFCQNWEISQTHDRGLITRKMTPLEWVALCADKQCPSISFTYNEPLVSYENTLAVAEVCKAKSIRTVLVSAGYINHQPLHELAQYLDAANIDLKAFDEDFHTSYCASTLAPVLETLRTLSRAGVHLEVTNLLIPGCNDNAQSLRAMCDWIFSELGPSTPFHFSAYRPAYRMSNKATQFDSLLAAWEIAKTSGLHHVYIGNVANAKYNSTFCPQCNNLLIERCGYDTRVRGLAAGTCSGCGGKIHGIW